jgi:hypothetical protein
MIINFFNYCFKGFIILIFVNSLIGFIFTDNKVQMVLMFITAGLFLFLRKRNISFFKMVVVFMFIGGAARVAITSGYS